MTYHIGQDILYTIRAGAQAVPGSITTVDLPGKVTQLKGSRVWIRLRSGEVFLPTWSVPIADPNLRPA